MAMYGNIEVKSYELAASCAQMLFMKPGHGNCSILAWLGFALYSDGFRDDEAYLDLQSTQNGGL